MDLACVYDNYKFNDYFKTDLPDHWLEKRLGYLAKEERAAFVDGPFGSDLKSVDYKDSGVPLIQLNNIRDSKHLMQNMKFVTEDKKQQLIRHLAKPGDVVIAKMAEPVARSAVVADDFSEYIIVADCVKMTPNLELTSLNYLVWAINCDFVRINAELVSTGTTRVRINLGELKKLKIPYPPYSEQQKIANFLDHETAKIDTLIDKQLQLITLLKEKRQAVISHAVTKGLNPKAPMRDSGVEWLGEVPEHWTMPKVAYIGRVLNGSTPDKTNLSYWVDGTIPWLASGCLNSEVVDEPSLLISESAYQNSSVELVPVDSLLVGMVGQGKTRGTSAILAIASCINQNMAAIIPQERIQTRFLYYLFQAMYDDLRELGRGGNQAALNCEIIGSIRVVLPPLDEQTSIISSLDKILSKLVLAEELGVGQIELLRERRTALISAAVTGKVDVRKWKAA